MTDFLVKRFVKDYENVGDAQVRTAYGVLASCVGIGCNVFLFVLKLLVGLAVHSVSVMSDAFNNLSDAASSIISFIGVRMAGQPADAQHPFGHGRIEYVAALIVSFLVIEVGWTLFKSSFDKVLHPDALSFRLLSVLILTASISVKLWMAYFNRKLGRRIDSSVMRATAADSLGDVLTTAATIVTLAVYGIWNVNIDGLVGVAVSVIIMAAGVQIARDTLRPLLGEPIRPEVYRQITQFVEGHEGIIGSHDLIVHNYGPAKSMASIHAEVPNNVEIEKSHEVIDQIEREAARELGLLLVIHMDPVAVNDEKLVHYRSLTEEAAGGLASGASIHDFRLVRGEKQVNLIFDLVVPFDFPAAKEAELKRQLNQAVQEKDAVCCCVITVERSYCAAE